MLVLLFSVANSYNYTLCYADQPVNIANTTPNTCYVSEELPFGSPVSGLSVANSTAAVEI